VYGEGQPPLREDQAPHPEDPYGIAKLAVELDLQAAARMWGLKHVTFRPHNVYGEYQNIGDPYRNVIGIFMNQIMRGEPMTIFGDGTQQRAFTYVGDIAPIIAGAPWVPEATGEVFNLGADIPYTVNELAREVASAMGVPDHPVVHLDARKEVHVAYSDHTKAERIFGKHAATSLSAGLAKMATWAKAAGSRMGKPFEGVEVDKGLPPSWLRLVQPK
jgi:UDP-glucose 4-epimerase